jgi:hypothetical protein
LDALRVAFLDAAERFFAVRKSVRALLRKSLKSQAAMISIPIARSINPVDTVGFTGFPPMRDAGRSWTGIAWMRNELDAA